MSSSNETTAPPPKPTFARRAAGLALRHVAPLLLLAVCAVGAARHESFLTPQNLLNVLRQNSMVGLMTLGMLFVMRGGGIDLSLGALLAAGGVVAAALSPYGSAAAGARAGAVTGLLGLGNGLLVSQARVQPFIATLATNMASRGMLLHWTAEESVRVAKGAAALKWLGRGYVGPLPVPVLIFLLAFALAGVVLA